MLFNIHTCFLLYQVVGRDQDLLIDVDFNLLYPFHRFISIKMDNNRSDLNPR